MKWVVIAVLSVGWVMFFWMRAFSVEPVVFSEDRLLNVLEEDGPVEAIGFLKAAAMTDDVVLANCHDWMHMLGRETYALNGDAAQALLSADEWCNSGYMHGVIEVALVEERGDAIENTLALCAPYSAESRLGWQCWHGVGHGLMFATMNDVPIALAICDEQSPAEAEACANGVYMENAVAEPDIHPTVWRNSDDILFPCFEPELSHRSACLIYVGAWYLSEQEDAGSEALSVCDALEDMDKFHCVQGVGMELMKRGLSDRRGTARACLATTGSDRDACMAGMANAVLAHDRNLVSAAAWCATIPWSLTGSCTKALIELGPWFAENP